MNNIVEILENIKQGYKKNELGWIPEDWEVVKIADVMKIGGGRDYKHLEAGNVPVYGTGGYITSVNNFLYEGESVGIGRKGTIDKPVFLKGKFWTVDTLFYTHSFKNILPYFVFVVFQSINWKSYNEATGVPSLSKTIIESIKIPLPSLIEQEKIAEILSTVDEKIEKVDKQIKQAEQLKKALMQELLTKGIGHTEFKETEIGRIPKKWQVLTLSEFASKEKNAIVDGPFGSNLKTEHYRTEGIPIIQSGFVTNNKFVANNYIYVDGEKFEKEIRSKVSPNDIVMAKIGANCGRCAIMPKTHPVGILAGNSLKITVSINNSTYYLLKLLHYYLEIGRFEELISRTAQPALSIGRLKTLKIPCPELLEQEKIATMAESIDEKIEILQSKKSEYEKLKKGLMQKLLTGQIRVRV